MPIETQMFPSEASHAEAIRRLSRLRPTKRPEFRVTIFGSARIASDHWVYAAVRELAAELARMGCGIVTGGGPGLMQAANEGAALAGPRLKPGASASAFIYLSNRKLTHLSATLKRIEPSSRVCIISYCYRMRLWSFPAILAQVLELAMIWQLLQVGKLNRTTFRPLLAQ